LSDDSGIAAGNRLMSSASN